MTPEQRDFCNAERVAFMIPAREAAWLIGLSEHEVPILVAAGLLKPLGQCGQQDKKMFSSIEIQNLVQQDPKWLSKCRNAIQQYWRVKNRSRRPKNMEGKSPQTMPPKAKNASDVTERNHDHSKPHISPP